MKKIISIILAAVLFTALTACGSSAQDKYTGRDRGAESSS